MKVEKGKRHNHIYTDIKIIWRDYCLQFFDKNWKLRGNGCFLRKNTIVKIDTRIMEQLLYKKLESQLTICQSHMISQLSSIWSLEFIPMLFKLFQAIKTNSFIHLWILHNLHQSLIDNEITDQSPLWYRCKNYWIKILANSIKKHNKNNKFRLVMQGSFNIRKSIDIIQSQVKNKNLYNHVNSCWKSFGNNQYLLF